VLLFVYEHVILERVCFFVVQETVLLTN